MQTQENTISDNEDLYKELTNGIPGAIFRYILQPDNTDRIAYMSAGCFAIWELDPQITISKPSAIWDMIIDKDVQGMRASILKSAQTLSFWMHEWQIITPSGILKTLYGTGSPRKLVNGDIIWNSVIIDVSAERHMQNALDSFFEQPFSLNAMIDLNGKFVKVNQLWETTLGYSKAELEGKQFLDFVHPDDVSITHAKAVAINNNTNLSGGFVNRYRHKNGSIRFFSWSSQFSTSEELFYASAIDITESRKTEEKIRQSAAVFQSTADGVMVTDLEHCILEVNQAFCNITGLSEEESIGSNLAILRSELHNDDFYQTQWQQINDTGNWHGQVWSRKKDGTVFPQLLTMSTIRKDKEPVGYVGVFSDISVLEEQKQKLAHLAHHDSLTNLPNRHLFKMLLSQSIDHASKHQKQIAIIFIDLDSFKHINDSMGHPVGDELLVIISERLLANINEKDTVARMSGDEFVLLLNDISDTSQVQQKVKSLLMLFRDSFYVNESEISLTASMGISMYPQDSQDISTLMANADAAMYKAKEEGKNTYQFYTSELTSQAVEFVFMDNALRNGLVQNQFFIQYQPQISSDTKTLIGLEALLRWRHPDKGLIPPDCFISIAEQNGTIKELGQWILKTSCEQAKHWLDQGYQIGRLAVNVSAVQFYDEDFLEIVMSTLAQTKLPPQHLELEITESLVIKQADKVIDKLCRLNELGVSVALDDFGTGYSSLSYLKKLPVNRLKIDKSFIIDIPGDADDIAITNAIIGLAHTLNLEVIAEGVETQNQVSFLAGKSCDYQGFLFSKPLDAEAVPSFIQNLIDRHES